MRVSRIHLHKKNLGVLSPLETDVLSVLWKEKDTMRVRDIHHSLGGKKKKVALTSVAVILDRLHEKKLVSRSIATGRGGEHYLYASKVSQEDFQQALLDDTVNKLIDQFGQLAVSYFHGRFSNKKGAQKVAG